MYILCCKTKAYLNSLIATESIKLVEQLQHRPLHLPVTTLLGIESFCANCIQLVDEYDSGGFLLGQLEGVSHQFRTISNEHLYERRTCQFEITGFGLCGAGSCQESLSGSFNNKLPHSSNSCLGRTYPEART